MSLSAVLVTVTIEAPRQLDSNEPAYHTFSFAPPLDHPGLRALLDWHNDQNLIAALANPPTIIGEL